MGLILKFIFSKCYFYFKQKLLNALDSNLILIRFLMNSMSYLNKSSIVLYKHNIYLDAPPTLQKKTHFKQDKLIKHIFNK